MSLRTSFGEHTVDQLLLMLEHGQLNLEPGFQRKSVWTRTDRQRLIQSIVAGFPLPNLFLCKRQENGRLRYDVIDGKQRLESVFSYVGLRRFGTERFPTKLDLGDGLEEWTWRNLEKKRPDVAAHFRAYKVQFVEVEGDLGEIVDVFVRINSTGKKLTSGEKRHAKFYNSPLLVQAEKLVRKHQSYLLGQKILSKSQLDRMKGVELFSELLLSIHKGGPINKKVALDRAIGNETIHGGTMGRLLREFTATLTQIKRKFPDLRQVRFHNSAEFYSLFMLYWEMGQDRVRLNDRKADGIANLLLRRLSTGVDELRENLRKAKPARAAQRIYADYLLTVQGDTDSSANRERRREILKGLVGSLYERKDSKRLFTTEQRRIIWNRDDKVVCARCKRPLVWDDFTVDHIRAWTRGGKTTLRNAQPMHRICNSAKGASRQ